MGLGSVLSSIVGGDSVKDLVLGVLDRIKLSPEKKAEIQQKMQDHDFELQKLDFELKKAEQELVAKEVETASANIRAEVTSGDKFTSRMRPSYGYMMIVILGCNYILFPLIGHPPINFPDALFWLFGSVMLGYTGARTWEKIGLTKELAKEVKKQTGDK